MTPDVTDLFEKLKKNKKKRLKRKCLFSAFFQLLFDEKGAWVRVVNEHGKEIITSHEYYTGRTREILKYMDEVYDRVSLAASADAAEDVVYLADHDYLFWQLLHSDLLVDERMGPVARQEDAGRLHLTISEENGRLSAELSLHDKGERFSPVRFINRNHVYTEGRIFSIRPAGAGYRDLRLFETAFPAANLEKYLSLFFSNFENVSVHYRDYAAAFGPVKQLQPALIFERVDRKNNLHLKVTAAVADFGTEFFENYDVTFIALVNELEKTITVRPAGYDETDACLMAVDRLLKKYAKALDGTASYTRNDALFIIQEALAREFLHRELNRLLGRYAVLGAEKLKSYNIRAVKPKLRLTLSHGLDFLEGEATLDIDGRRIPLFSALAQHRKKSYISLSDGVHAIADTSYFEKLERIFRKNGKQVRMSVFDAPLIEDLIDARTARRSLNRLREIYQGFNAIGKETAAYPRLNATMRDYQKQGYLWAAYLGRHALGGCLADDMGLGKTIQAIALLAAVYPGERRPSLIVMPKSLLFNWENEIQKFRPELTYYTFHGAARDMDAARARHLILTTYAMLRNQIDKWKNERFHYVILDESQNIKNVNSQVFQAALRLNSRNRLALSGSPVENNLGELYALFRFLNPAMFGTMEEFNRHYALPIQRNGDKAALKDLKKKIYPFILRRVKQDVLRDLPDKTEQILYVEMSEEQKAYYEERRLFYCRRLKEIDAEGGGGKAKFVFLQALSELRQIASIPEARQENGGLSPKREALMNAIENIVAGGHKALVFANYLHALDGIAADLDGMAVDYLLMTGATRDRKRLVRQFQEDEACKVFLMTLKTGGAGLNLTAADYVFIFDPWWNVAAENQAVDRTHRIGQRRKVFSYKLIARETVEEKIMRLQQTKARLFGDLIGADGPNVKSLHREDIEFILGM